MHCGQTAEQSARAGFDGGESARLPHVDAIQRSFGPAADLSSVRAHTGAGAKAASASLGARAYTSGRDVAFGEPPSLRLAAHEAAHVLQQEGPARVGQPPDGVGRPGDAFERSADEAADLAAGGRSAAHLFGPPRAGSGEPRSSRDRGAAIQLDSFPSTNTTRTDLKQQAHNERYAKYLREKRKAQAENAKPESKSPGPEEDTFGEKVDEVLGNAGKKTKALATANIEEYPVLPHSELDEALDDVKSGTDKLNEYLGYVTQVADYYKKTGKMVPFQGVLDKMSRITKTLSHHLGTIQGYVTDARAFISFVGAVDSFIEVTRKVDFTDAKSIQKWLDALKKLRGAADPYISWAKKYLYDAALAGEEIASRTLIIVQYLDAMYTIGSSALENTLKVEHRYFDAMDRHIREATGEPDPNAAKVPEPQEPASWTSADELHAAEASNAKQTDRSRLVGSVYRKYDAEKAKSRAAFDDKVFPKMWLKLRGKVYRKIDAALTHFGTINAQNQGYFDLIASWRNNLTMGHALEFQPRVSLEVGKREIADFKQPGPNAKYFDANMRPIARPPPCPYFEEVYQPALKQYLSQTVQTPEQHPLRDGRRLRRWGRREGSPMRRTESTASWTSTVGPTYTYYYCRLPGRGAAPGRQRGYFDIVMFAVVKSMVP